jgi:hypothetical protein
LTDGVTGGDVTKLRLPLSGMVYQRRNDGRWRCVHPAQYDDEQAGLFHPHPDEWVPADRPVGGGGRAQRTPGSGPRDKESWWLAYGDNRLGPVTVTLADGRTPPIITFGPLWISEWVSRWQAAMVFDGKRSYQIFHRAPHYIESQNQE